MTETTDELSSCMMTPTYLTREFWESREAYETFRQKNSDAHDAADREYEKLAEQEGNLGAFERPPTSDGATRFS